MSSAARLIRLMVVTGLLVPLLGTLSPVLAQPNPDPDPGQGAALLDDPGLTLSTNTIYYPWVANDDDFGLGPADTSITIQNLEALDTYIYLYKGTGTGWSLYTTAYLAPWASKTFSADALGIAAGEGVPVAVSAFHGGLCVTALGPGGALSLGRDVNGNATCTDREMLVTLFDELPEAEQVDVCVAETASGLPAPYWDAAAGAYQSWDDVEDLEAFHAAGGQFGGLNNDGDCSDVEGGVDALPTVIAGVAKTAVDGETLPYTTVADTAVSGYNALNGFELDRFDQWYLPIVQTNCGPGGCWDTVIRAANYSGANAAIELRFFPADDGSGSLNTGFQVNLSINGGETQSVVLSDYVPEGWVGSVHAYSDADMMLMADRFKVGYHMWLTNTGSSADFEHVAQIPGGLGQYVLFAPDVRVDYFGWNTGINVANLSEGDNNVTVQYFNLFGNATGTATQRLAPHGMTYFYDPSIAGQDNSSQDPETDLNEGVVGSALIWSDAPVAAAVDATKYPETTTATDQQVFQGTTYSATANVYPWQAVPLVQKGNPATGLGATSGINMLNPNSVAAQALVYWINQSGFGADNFGTSALAIPAYANGFVYTLAQHNLPNGFYGAALVTASYPIAATSANVDYQVQYDGSVIWNAFNPCGFYRTPGVFDCYLGDPLAPPAGGSVKKLFVDEAGEAVVGVPVHLYNETAYERYVLGNSDYPGIPWDASGWSDVNGEILWTNVPAGDYWLVTEDQSAEGFGGIAAVSGATQLGPWLESFTLSAGQDLVITNTLDEVQAVKTVRTNMPATGPANGTDGIYSGVYVFPDLNGNGQFDPEDLGFAPGETITAEAFYAAALAAQTVDGAGEARFPLLPGSYLALVDAEGYAPRWEGFALDPGEEELNILDVGEDGTLRLLVETSQASQRALAQTGTPVAGARVTIYAALPFSDLSDDSTWGELVDEGETGSDGVYEVDLPPGEYVVCAEGPVSGDIQYAARCIFVTIVAGETTEAVIDLAISPWLDGVVRDALTDAPVADATVTVSQSGQELWSGLTNDLGEFTVTYLDGLQDGAVRIEVNALNYVALDEVVSYQAAVDVLDGYLEDDPPAGEGTYDATMLLGLTAAEVSIFGQVDCNSDDVVDDATVNTLANTNASCSDIPSPTAVGDDTAGQPFGGLNVTGSQIIVFAHVNPLPDDVAMFASPPVPPTGGATFTVTAGRSYTFCIFYEEDGDGIIDGTGDEDFVCTDHIAVDESGYSNAADKLTLHLLGSTHVVSTDPLDGAANVSVEQVITITFNRPAEVAAGAFTLECPVGTAIPFTVSPPLPATATSFTLTPDAPLPEGVECVVTVLSSAVTDMLADFSFTFTTNTAPFVTATNPEDDAVNVATNQVVTVTFSEPVDVAAGTFTWECPAGASVAFTSNPALPATGATMVELTPTSALPEGVLCTVTVLATGITASDGVPPVNLAADYVFSFTTDIAPTVLSTVPADGGGVGPDSVITVQFSEPVNVTAAAFTIVCDGAAVAYSLDPAAPGGVADYTLTPAGGLPPGASCTLTVVADQVTDVDSGDPPNTMAADYVVTFNVDAPPSVISTDPADLATGVAVDASITINFSEPVNVTASAFTLECPVGAAIPLTNTTGTGPATTFTLDPDVDLPNGVLCTATVVADQVSDDDATDPPNNMLENFVFTFTTVDIPPTVTSTDPADLATGVSTGTSITINFSEPVNVTATAFTLECPAGTAIPFTNTTGTGPATSFTLDPTSDLPPGETCTVTVVADQVTDADSVDPPGQMAANYVFSFTTDVPPTVTGTVPIDGATDVAPDATITINFSEPVNATTASFIIECPDGSTPLTFTLTASPATSFTLTPDADLPSGETCTVTVVADQITDADSGDPPDTMEEDYVFSFSVPLVAADLTYTPTIVGNVGINTANSTSYSVITENGIPTVTGANVVSATTANDGTVVMDTSTGTFSYNPPAGFTGTDTFDYTLTAGAITSLPGTVTLTVAGMVWFVNNAAPAGGDGRLTNPYNCLVGAGCLVTTSGGNRGAAGDAIFIYTGSGAYTAGLTLLNNQRLIGQGSSQVFVTASGLTFPADVVTLPSTGGTDPLLTTSNVDAVALTNGAAANLITGLTIGNTGTGYAISGTSFGTLTVSDVTINGTGGALNLGTGTLAATFESITSTGSANIGISLTSVGGTLTVAGATSITDPSNQGLNLSGSSVAITMASLTVSEASVGINMTNQSGVVTINGGGISSTLGVGVSINGGNANFTYAGSIASSGGYAANIFSRTGTATVTLSGTISNTTQGLRVANNGGGTVIFSGGSKVLNTGANHAVTLDNNTGTLIQFTNGGLDIDTTSGSGFVATGGGTVEVSGSGNTITSEALALNISNVTIGAGNVTFQSITSSGSATNAIILNATGASGGLRVTGTGTTLGSGGLIAGKTNAILLTGTSTPTFNYMAINTSSSSAIVMRTTTGLSMTGTVIDTTGFHAIHGGEDGGGQNVGLTLTNVQILNAGNSANDDAMYFANTSQTNLTGTVTITDSVFQTFFAHGFNLYNTSGTTGITISNGDFSDSDEVNGSTAVQIQGAGSSTTTLTVGNGSLFDDLRLDGIFANALDAASTVTVNVSGSTFEDGVVAGGGVTLSSDNGDLNFNVSTNTFQRLPGPNFQVLNDKDGVMNGTFFDNDIIDPGSAMPVHVRAEGGSGTGLISTTVDINQNTIEGSGTAIEGAHGIRVINRGLGNLAGVMNITIRNNTVGTVGSETGDVGLYFDLFDDSETYVYLSNNIVRALNSQFAMDWLVYDDADGANDEIPAATVTIAALTMENNQFFGSAGATVLVGTDEPAQFCLDIRSNSANGGSGTFDLDNTGGTYVVEGAGTGAVTPADITALVNSGTILVSSGINFNNGVQCQMPAVPTF